MARTLRTPRIVAIVPMRHHSERVRGKNYRLLSGKPLFHHILQRLLASSRIAHIVVDTDSETIKRDVAEAFPTVQVVDRPEHLRDGATPMNDVLINTVSQVPADYYLQTHSTNPLLRTETIDRAIDAFLAAVPERDSLFGCTRLQTRLWTANAKAINHDANVLLRTQDLPPIYEENSNIYLFDRKTLEARGNRIGYRPMI